MKSMTRKSASSVKCGLTLIEVMIATTLTVLLMLALAQGFKALSDTVSEGRAKLGLSDQLRSISSILRADLDRCTVSRQVPQSYPGPGYFKYYDGPIWDATGLQYNFSLGNPLQGSRWGDIDDILMFTAQADPGEVFRGTIPQALMFINQLNAFAKAGKLPGLPEVDNFISTLNGIGWETAWKTEVTIESDYAEIVWFMLPLLEGNRLPVITPPPVTTPPSATYIETTVTQSVIDVASPIDGMPDKVALCRRVLPIRRDIDLNPNPIDPTTKASIGAYRSLILSGLTDAWAPRVIVNTSNSNSFRTAMHQFNQRCDLSLRVQNWQDANGSFVLSVAANSLEDLQLPENRFAHFTLPVSGIETTLPVLALTSETGTSVAGSDTAAGYRAATDPVFSVLGGGSFSNRGFLPPWLMRSRFDGTPMLSEIVASNVIGFDVKAFDPAAKQLAHPGPDGVFGDPAFTLPGLSGTDDASVGPSDPGYGSLLLLAITGTATPVLSSQGAYCDMGWGFKLHTHPLLSTRTALERASVKEYFRGDASGIVNMTPVIIQDPALNASGSLYMTSGFNVYQPVYDTYTDFYETDGEKMNTATGYWFYRGGLRRFGFTIPAGDPDDIANGVRNPRLYVDAYPPAPFEIPSIKVTLRIEDVSAGQLQQMMVIHSFPK